MWYENDSSTRRFGESTIITLDMENAKEYGQYEFMKACVEMGIIKEL